MPVCVYGRGPNAAYAEGEGLMFPQPILEARQAPENTLVLGVRIGEKARLSGSSSQRGRSVPHQR